MKKRLLSVLLALGMLSGMTAPAGAALSSGGGAEAAGTQRISLPQYAATSMEEGDDAGDTDAPYLQDAADGAEDGDDTVLMTEYVEGTIEETIIPDDSGQPDDIRNMDNDALFDMYLNRLISGENEIAPVANYGEGKLEGVNKEVYNLLKEQIAKVARGEETSTQNWIIKTPEFGDGDELPSGAIELGTMSEGVWANPEVISGTADHMPDEDAVSAVIEDLSNQVKWSDIIDCLLVDCPYELYWFDKTIGYKYGYAGSRYSFDGHTGNVAAGAVHIPYLTFSMVVASAYQDDGNQHKVNNTKVTAAENAIQNAQEIARKYSVENNPAKLMRSFKDEICDLVSYNHTAAENNNTPYGDPWQLVYVFDKDPKTEVVCEGYSKAFQYLCDLAGLTCYTVTGVMGGGGTGAGAHMWNIVTLDHKQYLVDVTNSDTDTVGQDGSLFLKAPASGACDTQYNFATAGGSTTMYAYDPDMKSLYGTAVLTLDEEDYPFPLPEATATITVNGTEITDTSTAIDVAYGDTLTVAVSDIKSKESRAVEENKLQLLYGEELLAEADVSNNGGTLTYATTGKLLPTDNNLELTVEYGGSDELADTVLGTFKVNLEKKTVTPAISEDVSLQVTYNGTKTFTLSDDEKAQISIYGLEEADEPAAGTNVIDSATVTLTDANAGVNKEATLTVTLTDAGLDKYYTVTGKPCSVTVNPCPLGLSYEGTPTHQKAGQTIPITITATGIPADGSEPRLTLNAVLTHTDGTAEAASPVDLNYSKDNATWTGTYTTTTAEGDKVMFTPVIEANGNYSIDASVKPHVVTIVEKEPSTGTVTPEETELTYGEELKVNVSGIKTNEAGNSNLRAMDLNKLYLYNGDILLDTQNVNSDGTGGTLSYKTEGKGLAIGANTLTVKYGGSDKLAANEELGTVIVTLNQKLLIANDISEPYKGEKYTDVPTELSGTIMDADQGGVTATFSTEGKDVGSYTAGSTGNNLKINFICPKDVNGKDYYAIQEEESKFIITAVTLVITGATLAEKTYDGTTTATVTGVTFGDLKGDDNLEFDTDYTATAVFDNANAGTGKTANVTVTLKDTATAKNYEVPAEPFELTGQEIKKAGSAAGAVTADNDEITYGDTLTVTATGIGAKANSRALEQNKLYLCDEDGKELASVDVSGTEGTVTYDTKQKKLVSGQHTLTVKYGGSANLLENQSLGTVTVTINPRQVTFDPITAEYTGKAYTNNNVTLKDVLNGDKVTAEVTTATGTAAGTYTVGGAANSLTVTLSGEDRAYYKVANGTLNINKAQLEVTGATLAEKTYDGTATAAVTGVTLGGLKGDDNLEFDTDYTATAVFDNANAGTGKTANVTVTLKDTATAKNYEAPAEPFELTGQEIKKAGSAAGAVTADNDEITYGDTLTVTATGIGAKVNSRALEQNKLYLCDEDGKELASVDVSGTEGTVTYDTKQKKLVPGQHTLTVKYGGSANLLENQSLGTVTVTINPRQVTFDPITAEYTGEAYTNNNVTLKDVLNGDKVTAEVTTATGTAAGTYTVGGAANSLTVTLSGEDMAYYKVANGTLNINKAKLEVTGATLAKKTYDGTATAAVTGVTLGGLKGDDNLEFDTDYTATAVFDNANAGTGKTANVTVTLKDTATAKNYEAPAEPFKLTGQTINKAAAQMFTDEAAIKKLVPNLTAEVDLAVLPGLAGASKDGELSFTVQQDGNYHGLSSAALASDGHTLVLTSNGTYTGEEDDTVTVTVSNLLNYEDSTITVTVKYVDKAVLTIIGVTADSKTYDGKAVDYDNSNVTVTGLEDGKPFDTSTLKYTWYDESGHALPEGTKPVDAGTYTLDVTVSSENETYRGVLEAPVSVTISKALVTVKAKDKYIRIGGEVPDLTYVIDKDYTVTGLVGGDTAAVTLSYEGGTKPSSDTAKSVKIKIDTVDLPAHSGNYDVKTVHGTLYIRRAGAILFSGARWADDDPQKDAFYYINKDAKFSLTGMGTDFTAAYYTSESPINISSGLEWKDYTPDTLIALPSGHAYICAKFTPTTGEDGSYYVTSPKLELLDTIPVIKELINGATYCEAKNFTVENIDITKGDTVTVNGKEVKMTAGGEYTLEPVGKQTITATNRAGRSVSVTVTVNNGHDFIIETIKPTCINEGIVKKTCKVCGKVVSTGTAAEGHEWESKSEEPTCIKPGRKFERCSVCGVVRNDNEITATGHTAADDYEYDSVNHWMLCEKCDAIVKIEKHTEGDWEEVTGSGKFEVKKCIVCGQETARRAKVTDDSGVKTIEQKTEIESGAPKTTLETPVTDLWDLVKGSLSANVKPTEDEKKDTTLDVNITLKLGVKPLEETSVGAAVQDEMEAIKAQVQKPSGPDAKEPVFKFIDISLNATKEVEGVPINQEKVGQTSDELEITINVPKEMYENVAAGMNRTFSMLYYHGDGAKQLPAANCHYDKLNHTFTFKTKEFSTYALVYTDTKEEQEQPPVTDNDDQNNGGVVHYPSGGGSSGSSSGGSSGGGGGGSATTPVVQDTNVSVAAKASDGKADANVDKTTADKMVTDAVKNKSANVNIKVNAPADAASVTATLPSRSAKDLADKTESALNVETPLATVFIPNDAVGELAGKGKNTVGVTAEKSGDDVKVTIQADGEDIGTLSGVKASIPTDKTGSGTVAAIVNPDDTETIIKKSMVKDGKIVVPLGGSATVRIADRSKSFDDTNGHWANDSIGFVTSRDLFKGVSEKEFAPDVQMTRAMLVTVLHRLEDNPESGENKFTDVPDDTWYTDAVAWAAANGIVNGKSDTSFAPNDPITREQLAAILYRYAKDLNMDTSASGSLNVFSDADDVSSYAAEAIRWAVGAGIINGKTSTTIEPQGNATRAEVSTMLMRLVGVMNDEAGTNKTEVHA